MVRQHLPRTGAEFVDRLRLRAALNRRKQLSIAKVLAHVMVTHMGLPWRTISGEEHLAPVLVPQRWLSLYGHTDLEASAWGRERTAVENGVIQLRERLLMVSYRDPEQRPDRFRHYLVVTIPIAHGFRGCAKLRQVVLLDRHAALRCEVATLRLPKPNAVTQLRLPAHQSHRSTISASTFSAATSMSATS